MIWSSCSCCNIVKQAINQPLANTKRHWHRMPSAMQNVADLRDRFYLVGFNLCRSRRNAVMKGSAWHIRLPVCHIAWCQVQ